MQSQGLAIYWCGSINIICTWFSRSSRSIRASRSRAHHFRSIRASRSRAHHLCSIRASRTTFAPLSLHHETLGGNYVRFQYETLLNLLFSEPGLPVCWLWICSDTIWKYLFTIAISSIWSGTIKLLDSSICTLSRPVQYCDTAVRTQYIMPVTSPVSHLTQTSFTTHSVQYTQYTLSVHILSSSSLCIDASIL